MRPTDLRPYLLTLCIGMLAPLLMRGQFTVYKTSADLINKTGTVHDGFKIAKRRGNKGFTIRNTSTKQKVDVDYDGIWAFSYKDLFYRVMHKGKYLSKAPDQIPVVLYLHKGAFFWLTDMTLDGVYNVDRTGLHANEVMMHPYLTGFITATVDGDAMLMSTAAGYYKESIESAKAFFTDHPELKWLQDCVEEGEKHLYGYPYGKVKRCMNEHEPEASGE